MGIGIILTAIVMGFALGGRKATISDAEVIERAKNLGMIDPNSGVLSQTLSGADNYEEENSITSDKELDQKREEIPQEINEIFAAASESVSGYAEITSQGEGEDQTSQGESSEASGNASEEKVKTEIVDTITETETSANKEESSDESKKTTAEATPGRTPESLASEKATTDSKTTDNKTTDNKTADNKTTDNKSTSENESAENKTGEVATAKPTTEDNSNTNNVKSTSGKALTIPKGMSSDAVAELLYQKGFVDSARSFNQYLIDRKMDRIIRSGDKVIPDGASYEEIANIICK